MKIDAANIAAVNFVEQAAAVATPANNNRKLYFKADGLYTIDDAGTELGPIGASSGQALAATAWVESDGDDSAGMLGDSARPFATIDAALDALPSTGGVIRIGVGTFAPVTDDYDGTTTPYSGSKLKNNVHFIGSGMPVIKSDNTQLVDGSGTVIQGPLMFHSSRSGIRIRDLGVDSGSAVVTALYGGTAQHGLAFANIGQTVALAQSLDIDVQNVVALCKSATAAAHAVLFENVKGARVRNVVGRFGTHCLVIKAVDSRFEGLRAGGSSTTAIIFREGNGGLPTPGESNSAPCYDVTASNIHVESIAASDTPVGILFETVSGQPLKRLAISNVVSKGIATYDVKYLSSSAAIEKVRVDNLVTDASSVRISVDSEVDQSSCFINGSALNAGTATAVTFRAYRSGTQSLSAGTAAKVQLNAESWDSDGYFDSTTNHRFQPLVAGYYQLNGCVQINQGAGYASCMIYKNGSVHSAGNQLFPMNGTTDIVTVADIVYLNGSTDYVELWAVGGGTSPTVQSLSTQSYLSGARVA